MVLPSLLVDAFVAATRNTQSPAQNTIGATVVQVNKTNDAEKQVYVRLDGQTTPTPIPVQYTADVDSGDRVLVEIADHTATIVGNATSPAARTDDVNAVSERTDAAKEAAESAADAAKEAGENAAAAAELAEAYKAQLEQALRTITTLQEQAVINGELLAKLSDQQSYIYVDKTTETPLIFLGSMDNPFRLSITNQALEFIEDKNVVAELSRLMLTITNAMITNRLYLSNEHTAKGTAAESCFAWQTRANGNCGLAKVKKGAD